jgi:hypothetical protein
MEQAYIAVPLLTHTLTIANFKFWTLPSVGFALRFA